MPGGSSLTPNPRSPPFTSEQRNGSSPGYFGLKVEPGTNIPTDSNPGGHVKKNWKTPSIHSPNTPNRIPHESDPGLADFRRQSETHTFTLGHGNNLSGFSSPPSSARTVVERSMSERTDSSAVSPATHIPGSLARQPSAMDIDDDQRAPPNGFQFGPSVPNFGLERRESPVNIPTLRNPSINEVSSVDDRHPRLSLPQQRVQHMTHSASPIGRASTLPTALAENPIFLSPQELIDLLQQTDSERLLLLDLRVSPQYSQSRIKGALNLCIPTTLLKRPSFNVQKLSETFTVDKEKDQFSHWKDVAYIVVYDANSANLKDAVSSVNTLKKFTNEGWKGSSCIIRGGFSEVSQKFPELVDKPSGRGSGGSNVNNLTINSGAASSLNVAGGCPMPAARTAANPFFGNIRQNMDLIGGVGQMSIKQPNALTQKTFAYLPAWLRKAANEEDKGKAVSDEFLNIEKAEQSRMQTALSTNVSYGTPNPNANSSIQVAGIEKGTKNRYKDILPFDHSRVHLDVEPGACDYINASHVKAEWSNRHYIATQAPVPATFEVS